MKSGWQEKTREQDQHECTESDHAERFYERSHSDACALAHATNRAAVVPPRDFADYSTGVPPRPAQNEEGLSLD